MSFAEEIGAMEKVNSIDRWSKLPLKNKFIISCKYNSVSKKHRHRRHRGVRNEKVVTLSESHLRT
jgi:hypothetical protein